jgi:hypothetical protein
VCGSNRPGSDGAEWQSVPEGMMNLLPNAGDIVVMSECLSHAVLPWRPTEKSRLTLQMRYKCGAVHAKHYAREGEPWPSEVLDRCSPALRAIVSGDKKALSELPVVPITEPRQHAFIHPPPPPSAAVTAPNPPALIVARTDAGRCVGKFNLALWCSNLPTTYDELYQDRLRTNTKGMSEAIQNLK